LKRKFFPQETTNNQSNNTLLCCELNQKNEGIIIKQGSFLFINGNAEKMAFSFETKKKK
jgi:uncharacterized protein (AIM24 family)